MGKIPQHTLTGAVISDEPDCLAVRTKVKKK